MSKIVNYYQKIKGAGKPKSDNDINVDDNSRWCIVGRSGSYKTTIALNILRELGFDKLYLVAKDITEPLYEGYLIPTVRKLEKRVKEPILQVCTDPSELPSVDEFDKDKKNIVVFDDMILNKNNDNIREMYMRGLKKGITSMFLSQSFFDMDKFLRKNLDYIILKSLSSVQDLKRILREFNSNDVDPSLLVEIHKRAISRDPMSFLMIDLKAQDPNRKYRVGFDGFIPITEN